MVKYIYEFVPHKTQGKYGYFILRKKEIPDNMSKNYFLSIYNNSIRDGGREKKKQKKLMDFLKKNNSDFFNF